MPCGWVLGAFRLFVRYMRLHYIGANVVVQPMTLRGERGAAVGAARRRSAATNWRSGCCGNSGSSTDSSGSNSAISRRTASCRARSCGCVRRPASASPSSRCASRFIRRPAATSARGSVLAATSSRCDRPTISGEGGTLRHIVVTDWERIVGTLRLNTSLRHGLEGAYTGIAPGPMVPMSGR